MVRGARPDDAPTIVEIYRHGFPADRVGLTVMGQEKGAEYVEALISESLIGGASPFFCAESGTGAVAGFIQIRLRPGGIFANNIYVSPDHRGMGVGRRLFDRSLKAAGACSPQTVFLDVFEENNRALQWYRRLGFKEVERSAWTAGALPPGGSDGDYFVSGKPQADIVHEHFGFSLLSVTTRDRSYDVGRLGDRWFRLYDSRALWDDDLLAALRRLGPSRDFFLILAESELGRLRVPASNLGISTRMSAQRDELLQRVAG